MTNYRFPIRRNSHNHAGEYILPPSEYKALQADFPDVDVIRELRAIRAQIIKNGARMGQDGLLKHIRSTLQQKQRALRPIQSRYR